MTKRIAVLGCGPSGLLAAWAVHMAGHDPVIYSVRRKSPIGGAQYLHHSIPNLTSDEPDGVVEYVKYGSAEGYASKVYGDPKAPTSWSSFGGVLPIWNLRAVYQNLWEFFQDNIVNGELVSGDMDYMTDSFPLVLSTIPRPALCFGGHNFESQEVWIEQYPEAPLDGKNKIIYDGSVFVSWYRQSNIFGIKSTEWPKPPTDPAIPVVRVRKPLRHSCDCFYSDRVVYLGRYGAWDKPLLTHHAYEGARDALHRL